MQRRLISLIVAGGAVLFLAGCGASDGDNDAAAAPGSEEATLSSRGEPGDGGAPAGASPGQSSGGADIPALDTLRKVVFTSELTLEAEDVAARYLEIGRIATSAGGFIADSQLIQQTRGESAETHASITVRVPASEREATLTRLRTLEGIAVKSERTTASEVTEEYTDLQSRLRNLERSEQQYLALLDQATTIQEILTVSERVDSTRTEIERIEGRLQVLDDLVDLATITVALQPAAAAAGPGDGGGTSVGEAWSDAWETMGEIARGASIAGAWAAVLLICAAPVLAVAGAARLAIRRRQSPSPAEG